MVRWQWHIRAPITVSPHIKRIVLYKMEQSHDHGGFQGQIQIWFCILHGSYGTLAMARQSSSEKIPNETTCSHKFGSPVSSV